MPSRASQGSPRVTVAMTTYNGAAYLEETIEGILNQSFTDFEFLIVDDGSSDQTLEIIRSYEDPRIRCLVNEQNLGISLSRNRAIREARSEFFAPTDQDDLSLPRRLETQVEYLDRNPETDLVSTTVDLLRDGRRRRDSMRALDQPVLVHMGLFFGRHNVTYSAICVRLEFLRRHDLFFDQAFHYAEDFDLYLRIASVGRMVTLDQPMVVYRKHGENTSIRQYKTMTANGQRSLGRAYGELLQRTLSDEEVERIWRVLVERRPAASLDEMDQIGGIMTEVLAAFMTRPGLVDHERQALRELASQVWWSVVVASGNRHLGFSALAQLARYSELSHWRPTLLERLSTELKIAATFWRRQ